MKPIILIDMNLSPEWAATLLAGGWAAVHWSGVGPANARDSEIIDWARSQDAVIFTHDLDFSTALALSAASRPSILQIRGRRVLPEHSGALVVSLLDRYRQELIDGALLTVDEQKHRVRILPLKWRLGRRPTGSRAANTCSGQENRIPPSDGMDFRTAVRRLQAFSYTRQGRSPTDRVRLGRHAAAMTQARSSIVTPGQPGYYHCVTRCVRRAWLCGFDRYSGKDYEHRKPMVVARIRELASLFSIAVMGYAVMSNHLHLVLSVEPELAGKWSDEEVAEHWLRLFPSREPEQVEMRRSALLANAEALALRRARLADLSWFMRCLDEFVARRANAEDKVKGRFWEGRFKCQHLADDRALAAAMAYVDLNPIRAGMADSLEKSDHTSVQQRLADLRTNPETADAPLAPIAGFTVFRFPMTASQYIDLVDWVKTGPAWHKRDGRHAGLAACRA